MIVYTWMLVTITLVSSSTLSDVDNLYTKLLQNYNKNIRPGDDQTIPTVVNITFNLVAIQEFDEVDGKFSVIGFFEVSWYDMRMTWNPLEYNNTYTMIFSQSTVWKPTLLIINPFTKIDELGKDFMSVRYFYNGYSYWSPGEILISSCSVDVTYFPFDEQTCVIQMMSWGTMPSEILLKSASTIFKLNFYSEHGTWKLVSTSAVDSIVGGFSLIELSTKMKRRPSFYLINIVLPVMFLMALNSCVFILPPESGERVSYSITVLLAIAVFMTLTGDNLPKTSEPMSLLSYFLTFDLVFSSVICVITMLGLRLHFKDSKHPVPSYIKRFVTCCQCKKRRKEETHSVQPFKDDDGKISTNLFRENFKEQKSFDTGDEISWKDVSKALDTILLFICLFCLILSVILFFVILT